MLLVHYSDFFLGIAIQGFPGYLKFSNPEIPGLSAAQSRDFGIGKFLYLTVFIVL